jgi:hypothetical protein
MNEAYVKDLERAVEWLIKHYILEDCEMDVNNEYFQQIMRIINE